MNKLYLASQSPRRAAILKELGVSYTLLLPDPLEDVEALEVEQVGESPLTYVERVTLAKLQAAKLRLQKSPAQRWAPILCADTTVCLAKDAPFSGEYILGKPTDSHHALEILQLLNGKTHWVHTAVALLINQTSEPLVKITSTQVIFGNHPTERLQAYVATNEPMGKAGAYGIQGLGSVLIERIHGSYSGVMGLPIFETSQLLDMAKIPFMLNP